MPNDNAWLNPGIRANPGVTLSAAYRTPSGGGGDPEEPGDFVEITGSGFGLPPNVVFYRKLSGTPGEPVSTSPGDGEIGTIVNGSNGLGYHGEISDGITGYALHVQDGVNRGTNDRIFSYELPRHRRFRTSYWIGTPEGDQYPGSNVVDGVGKVMEPGDFSEESGFKIHWRQHSPGANSDRYRADICIPTHTGKGVHSVTGNATTPMSTVISSAMAKNAIKFGGPNVIDYASDCDGMDSVNNPAWKQFRISNDLINSDKSTGTRTVTETSRAAFRNTTGSLSGLVEHGNGDSFAYVVFGGLSRKYSLAPEETQSIICNIYEAVESEDGAQDWRQCLWGCNAATIEDSTLRVALWAPDWEWTDTKIAIPRALIEWHPWITHLIVERADGTEYAQEISP